MLALAHRLPGDRRAIIRPERESSFRPELFKDEFPHQLAPQSQQYERPLSAGVPTPWTQDSQVQRLASEYRRDANLIADPICATKSDPKPVPG